MEHHSQASDPEIKTTKGTSGASEEKDTDAWDKERSLRQLAVENWDAPIIVTTSVQFFDSLFSRRPADARKLHNICQSVVIFDEVQTLPPLLLQPMLDVLKELANPDRPYGCSLLLCTATQPALTKSESLECGFEKVTPIINKEDVCDLFAKLSRVHYKGLSKGLSKIEPVPVESFATIAGDMFAAPKQQALVILNTRKQARDLFDIVKTKAVEEKLGDAFFHLSTWMYPAHRLLVLAEVEQRLARGIPCFLVATQCVEAGVDVDFPAVWRAFGPYDSIVQAAGRCNRNGALDGGGVVHVFQPEDVKYPRGVYESAIKNTELLRKIGQATPENPASFETYFRLFYETTVPDIGSCAIQAHREQLRFKEVDEQFNFIDADNVPLVIETAKMEDGGTVRDWLAAAKAKGFLTLEEWRKIQPYIVNLAWPVSERTRTFLNRTNSELVFKNDDPLRGLRRMHISDIYSDGKNDSGLDVSCAAFADLANYNL